MSAQVIDGRAAALAMRGALAERHRAFHDRMGRAARLDVVLVGDDPASRIYVAAKAKAAALVGMETRLHSLQADSGQEKLTRLVQALSADILVDGILVQLPLPAGYDRDRTLAALAPEKDVDGLTLHNQGRLVLGLPGLRPCTPLGIVALARSALSDGSLSGAHCAVLGRSILVGRPTAALLLAEDCTVTQLHSRSRDSASLTRKADIVVAAIGRAGAIGPEFIKPGAIVIDVGINRTPEGILCGDLDFAAVRGVAGAISPVPGGVGPMTIACLLENTLAAAEGRVAEPPAC